ncbi:hypothetical protein P3T23_009776, partial [Paraburkholderia sp. GAS448]
MPVDMPISAKVTDLLNPSHAALSPEQRAFLDRLARCSLSDAAFLVA